MPDPPDALLVGLVVLGEVGRLQLAGLHLQVTAADGLVLGREPHVVRAQGVRLKEAIFINIQYISTRRAAGLYDDDYNYLVCEHKLGSCGDDKLWKGVVTESIRMMMMMMMMMLIMIIMMMIIITLYVSMSLDPV